MKISSLVYTMRPGKYELPQRLDPAVEPLFRIQVISGCGDDIFMISTCWLFRQLHPLLHRFHLRWNIGKRQMIFKRVDELKGCNKKEKWSVRRQKNLLCLAKKALAL